MVKNGYDVQVITSHTGIKKKTKEIDGIKILYLPISYDNSFKFWARSIAYLKFAFLACLESSNYRKIDLCYVMTTPLTTGLIALYNKYLHKRPYIFEVGDLWPLVPIEMGFIRNSTFANLLYRFEAFCYKKSTGSIGLSTPITEYIKKSSPTTSVETVYNISDCEFFQPQSASADLKSKYNIKDEFVITYAGTFGIANDLTRMAEVMKGLQHLPIKFLYIGMGAEKEKFAQAVVAQNLQKCSILAFQDKIGMQEIFAVSDAMLISFANYDSLFTGSPNKLFDALAAGLMVITNFDGWIKELIESETCGFSFVHDSANDFETKIKLLLEDPEKISNYKKNARKLAESKYSLKIQSKIQQDFLNKVSH